MPDGGMILTVRRKLALRAAVNEWISKSFPDHRALLSHEAPTYKPDTDAWAVQLTMKLSGMPTVRLGSVLVGHDASILAAPALDDVLELLSDRPAPHSDPACNDLVGEGFEFPLR